MPSRDSGSGGRRSAAPPEGVRSRAYRPLAPRPRARARADLPALLRPGVADPEGPPRALLPFGERHPIAHLLHARQHLAGLWPRARPLARERTVLDLAQDGRHARLEIEVHEARAPGERAVLRGVRVEVHLPHHPHLADLL